MAWTAPKTWAASEIVLASGTGSLNEQIRDNLTVLSTHAHTGAAGMGASTLSAVTLGGLNTVTFADQSGNPSTNGRLQRNGANLLYYDGSSAIDLTASDQAAGTGSLRTLGTGATQAAAGNHTHVQTATTIISNVTGSVTSPSAWGTGDSNEQTFSNIAVDTASANNSLLLAWNAWASNQWQGTFAYNMDVTIKIYYNSALVQTITGFATGQSLTAHGTIRSYARMPASAASHNFYFTMQPESAIPGSPTVLVYGRFVYNVVELQATI
jgi:hypothetical protein